MTVILGGLELREHRFTAPLDHGVPDGETIELFVREVSAAGDDVSKRPWLLFLQGGPGFESPRPLAKDGWIAEAVKRYRVALLDQRGTGNSTMQSAAGIAARGDARAQAEHLRHFRADSIVRDAELIRGALGVECWTLLGQSFGGFCALHYMCAAPDALDGVLITGGLPSVDGHADDVYRRTFPLTAAKCEALHRRFPRSAEAVRAVFARLLEAPAPLPSGDLLTPERLQSIGIQLGFSTGAATLHYLFEGALDPVTGDLAHPFLRGVERLLAFDTNPLYAILHEACYGQGRATAWSAQRERESSDRFDAAAAIGRGEVPLFTGEMVFPWVFEQYGVLRPLSGAAELLAHVDDWPALYDVAALRRNQVPVAAAVYADDMFVPADLSIATARRVRGLSPWVTNEYEHDGLRADGARLFRELHRRLVESRASVRGS